MIGIWKRMGRKSTFIVGILIGVLIMLPLWLTPIYHPVAYETIIVDNEILYNDMYQYYIEDDANWTEGDKVILISLNTTAAYRNIGMTLSGSEDIDLYVLCFYKNVGMVVGTIDDPELDVLYTVENIVVRGVVIFLNLEDPVLEIKIWVW